TTSSGSTVPVALIVTCNSPRWTGAVRKLAGLALARAQYPYPAAATAATAIKNNISLRMGKPRRRRGTLGRPVSLLPTRPRLVHLAWTISWLMNCRTPMMRNQGGLFRGIMAAIVRARDGGA